MALSLSCSSPSSLYQPLHNSTKLRLSILQFQSKTSLQINSLKEPNAQSEKKHPEIKRIFTSKSYAPVTLKTQSLRLSDVSESLDSCKTKEDVTNVLNSHFSDGNVVDKQPVFIINNMTNSKAAVFTLGYFLERFNFNKEVIFYNVTIKVCRNCRDFVSVEKLFDKMIERGVQPDNATFSTIIGCARVCNLADKAVEFFEKMLSFGLRPDDFTRAVMIDCYGRVGKVEVVLDLYGRARNEGWRIDAATYATLFKIFGNSGDFDECLNVYEEMKALGVKPNFIGYNNLLGAMGRAKRPWEVKRIYKEMIENGLRAGYATYTALLRAYCRGGCVEDAFIVYKEIKESNFELDTVLYNHLLSVCTNQGCATEAIEIFQEMKNSGVDPDNLSFTYMIRIFSAGGQVSETENMLNEMVKAGFEPDLHVWVAIIQCYAKAQRIDEVVRTFNQLRESGVKLDEPFCGCLLNVLSQTPKEELGKITECIETTNLKLGSVVKLLILEEATEGNFKEKAIELFDTSGADVKKSYCNSLIDLCVNLNKLDRACELLELGVRLEIYRDLQSWSATQWSLHLKSLSIGAGLTALHVWINSLSNAVESGVELPQSLAINTGHGKHRFSDDGLAAVLESQLKELNAPFYEGRHESGWFLATKAAVQPWLESRNQTKVGFA